MLFFREIMLFCVMWEEICLFALAIKRLDFSPTRVWWRVNLVMSISISEKVFTLNKSSSAISSYFCPSFSLPLVEWMGVSWQPPDTGLENSFNETFKLGIIWREMWCFCSCKILQPLPKLRTKWNLLAPWNLQLYQFITKYNLWQ